MTSVLYIVEADIWARSRRGEVDNGWKLKRRQMRESMGERSPADKYVRTSFAGPARAPAPVQLELCRARSARQGVKISWLGWRPWRTKKIK